MIAAEIFLNNLFSKIGDMENNKTGDCLFLEGEQFWIPKPDHSLLPNRLHTFILSALAL